MNDCDNTTHVCSCAFWAKGAVAHDDDCNIWLNDPATRMADTLADTRPPTE